MRVIALQRGHDGVTVREPGEEFEVSQEQAENGSTWFVPAEKAPAPKPVERNARPPGAGPKAGSKTAAEPVE